MFFFAFSPPVSSEMTKSIVFFSSVLKALIFTYKTLESAEAEFAGKYNHLVFLSKYFRFPCIGGLSRSRIPGEAKK